MRSIAVAVIAGVAGCARPAPPPPPAPANHASPFEDRRAAGEQMFVNKGCNACHTTDGTSRIGRSMKGIWDKDVTLSDGRVAHVDGAYIRDALAKPTKYNVPGFPANVMPAFDFLTAREVDALVAYIQSLE